MEKGDKMGYEVYSTKPGATDSKTWKWVLTREGDATSRAGAARRAKDIKERDADLRVVVYAFGVYRYTV